MRQDSFLTHIFVAALPDPVFVAALTTSQLPGLVRAIVQLWMVAKSSTSW